MNVHLAFWKKEPKQAYVAKVSRKNRMASEFEQWGEGRSCCARL